MPIRAKFLRAAVMDDMGGFTRACAQQNERPVWCRRLALAAALGCTACLVARSPTVQHPAIANQQASSAPTHQHADGARAVRASSRTVEPPSPNPTEEQTRYTLCQALGPAAPYPVSGLDC